MDSTGKGIYIALTAFFIVLAAAFAVFAYGRYETRDEFGQDRGRLASGSDSESPEGGALAVTAERVTAAENPQTQIAAGKAPIVAKETPVSVAEPSGRSCSANDLSGKAASQRTGSNLTGALLLKNMSATDCMLSSASRISFGSGARALSDAQTSWPSRGMRIPAGEERLVNFSWSNWCGGSVSSPVYSLFTLPDGAGYLRIPLISSLGQPQYDAPRCENPALFSTVSLWW